ncbi:hypothetical protein P879_02478 [Paragonimus westermani]|uniref:Saposin B-type domain-containing protein n=1 Tax=Paragonimus westermani TaxID=34504 RepID=A0A8T0DJA8_9TREM|nr:hypothetical protein P879_02478 [Paragonimus westermani]
MKAVLCLLSAVFSVTFAAPWPGKPVTKANDVCFLCKEIVEMMEDAVETGIPQQVLEKYLSTQCDKLHWFVTLCKMVAIGSVEYLADQVEKLTPEKTCKNTHLC